MRRWSGCLQGNKLPHFKVALSAADTTTNNFVVALEPPVPRLKPLQVWPTGPLRPTVGALPAIVGHTFGSQILPSQPPTMLCARPPVALSPPEVAIRQVSFAPPASPYRKRTSSPQAGALPSSPT